MKREELEQRAASINRHTTCAATVDERAATSRHRRERWRLTYRLSILGAVLVSARRHGRARQFIPNIPPHVLAYADCDERGRCATQWADLPDAANGSDILRASKAAGVAVYTVSIKHDTPGKPVLGILLSCEVGDSGSGPSEFLPLRRLTHAKLSQAVDALENYTRDLEVETGWAEIEEASHA